MDGAIGNAGATSSAGSASHAGASAVAGSLGASGASGASNTGSAGAPASAACSLPWDPGSCDGFVPSWWHDARTGLCQPLVYGGCGGNGNRFATRDECIAACPELGENFDKCLIDSDCAIEPAGCCEACEPALDEHLLSVAKQYQTRFHNERCATSGACLPCPSSDELEETTKYFRAVCENQQCTLEDIRSTGVVRCTTDADCVLRDGAECCPQCDGAHWVAARKGADFCRGALAACDECVSTPPAGLSTQCVEGVCSLSATLR